MRHVKQASLELDVARRLLELLSKFETTRWSHDYIYSLQDVLERAHACMNDSNEQLARFASTLALNLQMARRNLLDEVPNAKVWIALARAITPGERLTVPRRLIRPVRMIENQLDLDAVKTGAWIRAWDVG